MPDDSDETRGVPDNDVVAVITGRDSVRAAVEELRREGFPEEDIRVLRGEAAVEEMEQPAKGVTPIARIAQYIFSEEGQYLEEYKEAAEAGGEIVAVHVEDKDRAELASEILAAHHATNVKFFGRFAITEMTLPADELSERSE
jgi:hypothetical protein